MVKHKMKKEDLVIGKFIEYKNYKFYGHDWYVREGDPTSEPVDHFIAKITAIKDNFFESEIIQVIKPPTGYLREVMNRKVGSTIQLYYQCDMEDFRYLPDDYLGHLLYIK